jgi:hypothetical protein
MNLSRWFFIFIFIVFPLNARLFSQHEVSHKDFRFFGIRGHSGMHIYTGESLEEALSNGYGAIEVRYGWQSNNPDSWQSMYLYPAYGLGWYSGFIGNPELLGTPGAVYGFISFPLFYRHRHQMIIEPAIGLSYDLKPYDQESNNLNDAIGSRFNVYFNINLGAQYRLNREMDLLYGIDLTHFSNGRTFRPNAGLNMFGFNVGFRYHFNATQNRVDNSIHPQTLLEVRPELTIFRTVEQVRSGRILIYSAGGLVQNSEDMGTRKQYSTHSHLIEYQYQFNTRSAVTAGLDFFYDNSLRARYPDQRLDLYGAHIGYDFIFWQLSFRMQAGSYIHGRGHEMKDKFFFRPAIKFDINQIFFTQVGLKTQAGLKADWVEIGAGIRLRQ